MNDNQDLALTECVLKEFTLRTKDEKLSTATMRRVNLFQT